jgi:hypothetical protein
MPESLAPAQADQIRPTLASIQRRLQAATTSADDAAVQPASAAGHLDDIDSELIGLLTALRIAGYDATRDDWPVAPPGASES